MNNLVSGFLLELCLLAIMIATLIALLDTFCERKEEWRNFTSSIIWYIVVYFALEYISVYFLSKRFVDKEAMQMIVMLTRATLETILEWVLFVGKYKGGLKKKIIIYISYSIILPGIEVFVLSIINKDLVIARIGSDYIQAINNVTFLIATYLIILIIGEAYRFIKYKKRNPQVVFFVLILIVQLILHYFFEKAFLSMVDESNMNWCLIGYVFSAIILLCISAIYQNHLKDMDYKRLENERQRSWEQKANYYQAKSGTTTELKKMEHDFKKHLLIINQLSQTNQKQELKDYLNSVTEYINPDNDIVDASNPVISTILTLMVARCRENDTSFKYNLGYKELRIVDFDLSTILGNILENAFEASIKVSDVTKRNIRLSIQEEKCIVFIRCQNYYTNKIEGNGKSIKSSKADQNNHGLGLSNVQDAVKRYDGEIDITTADQIFEIQIVLRNPTK